MIFYMSQCERAVHRLFFNFSEIEDAKSPAKLEYLNKHHCLVFVWNWRFAFYILTLETNPVDRTLWLQVKITINYSTLFTFHMIFVFLKPFLNCVFAKNKTFCGFLSVLSYLITVKHKFPFLLFAQKIENKIEAHPLSGTSPKKPIGGLGTQENSIFFFTSFKLHLQGLSQKNIREVSEERSLQRLSDYEFAMFSFSNGFFLPTFFVTSFRTAFTSYYAWSLRRL